MSGPRQVLVVLAGPPADRDNDQAAVDRLLSTPGKHVVCGGTTASIVARRLGQTVKMDVTTGTQDVPPTGELVGIDMVTEGSLTLAKALEEIRSDTPLEQLRSRADGASRLAVYFREANKISLLVGTAANPAHQNGSPPNKFDTKPRLMRALGQELRHRGKEVHTEYF